jgi:endonuclease YncB( thermonuclease family)
MRRSPARFRIAWWRRWGPWLALALVVALRLAWRTPGDLPEGGTRPPPAGQEDRGKPLPNGFYRVRYVIDGDTLLLEGESRRVRLEGVDAPELSRKGSPEEPWSREAVEFVRAFVQGPAPLRLESSEDGLDRYGRHLVFLWRENELLNEQLIRAGLARAMVRFPYRTDLKRRFAAAEKEARQAGRGIWRTPSPVAAAANP